MRDAWGCGLDFRIQKQKARVWLVASKQPIAGFFGMLAEFSAGRAASSALTSPLAGAAGQAKLRPERTTEFFKEDDL